LVVFVEAEWQELNKPHDVVIELLDQDSEHVQFRNESQLKQARIAMPLTVPSIPGAPNGTPGRAHLLVELGTGSVQMKHAPGRLIWRVTVGANAAETGFWVHVPPSEPQFGL